MSVEMTRMSENGRVLIPASYRKELGFKPGEALTLRMDESGLHIQSRRQAILKVRENMRIYIKPGRSMSDKLIAERRLEAKREQGTK
jgi:AbrB family looped-hinge helix DNA binding protein